MTKDPLTVRDSDGQSLNRYVYALNNPIRFIDITGLSPSEGSVGQPEFAESLIPVWGSGRAAIDYCQTGEYA